MFFFTWSQVLYCCHWNCCQCTMFMYTVRPVTAIRQKKSHIWVQIDVVLRLVLTLTGTYIRNLLYGCCMFENWNTETTCAYWQSLCCCLYILHALTFLFSPSIMFLHVFLLLYFALSTRHAVENRIWQVSRWCFVSLANHVVMGFSLSLKFLCDIVKENHRNCL